MGRPVHPSAFDQVGDEIALTALEFRAGMARLAAAVSVVTTDGPSGRAGFTATSVCSVTDAPPTLLVCLNRSSSVRPRFVEGASICVNVLAASQEATARLFSSGATAEQRFAGGTWHRTRSGAFALAGALVCFDGRIRSAAPVGTHDVLFCEIDDVLPGDNADALVYRERRYHSV